MLKIKDSVDLKELEKFGFKPQFDEDTGEIIAYKKNKDKTTFEGLFVKITEPESKIRIYKSKERIWKLNPYENYYDLDMVYDLIQAGLVEKV